jgi:hypothetical protein
MSKTLKLIHAINSGIPIFLTTMIFPMNLTSQLWNALSFFVSDVRSYCRSHPEMRLGQEFLNIASFLGPVAGQLDVSLRN